MKKTLKSIIIGIFCAFIAIASASTGIQTVYAAKKVPLRITFNGKSVNLIKDIVGDGDSQKLKTLEKKWGKPNKKTGKRPGAEYIWKKGKTKITVSDTENGEVRGISISIKDKNGAMFGVKVGMDADKVLKKMQKMFGKKNVAAGYYYVGADGFSQFADTDGITEKTESITLTTAYMPFGFSLKDGKVTSMSFWRS